MSRNLPGVESSGADAGTRSVKEDPAMRRFALLLGIAFSFIATHAVAQNCDGSPTYWPAARSAPM
jgi:hypothetical protein